MIGKILRWGNSYGIRLAKNDVEALGLHEGEEIAFDLKTDPHKRIDLSWMKPAVADGKLRQEHDRTDWQ